MPHIIFTFRFLIAFLFHIGATVVLVGSPVDSKDDCLLTPAVLDCDSIQFIVDAPDLLCDSAIIYISTVPNYNAIWVSSDESVAIINNNGVAVVVGNGCVTFTMIPLGGGIECTTDAFCVDPLIMFEDEEVCVGSSTSVSNLNQIGGVFTSSNAVIATIDITGNVTCHSPGQASFAFYSQECVLYSEPILCLPCYCELSMLNNNCETPVFEGQEFYTEVCAGDTSIFYLKNCFELPFPIKPTDISITGGTLLSYQADNFAVIWNNEEFGGVSLTAEFDNGVIKYYYLSVNISPITDINIFDGTLDSHSSEICIGEQLYLQVTYEDLLDPKWEISDGQVLYGFDQNITFHEAGTYTITVSNKDECTCVLPAEYIVTVKGGESPTIQCVRTVCIDEEVTYYSGEECDTYDWTVSPEGTVIDGGGSNDFFITVLWNNGLNGELSLTTPGCSTDLCQPTTVADIYIISPTTNIEGKTKVCSYDIETYSITPYQGTEFVWSISSNDGYIINGQGTNTIQIQWYGWQLTNTTVIVDYTNCNISCDGHAELPVEIKTEIKINTVDSPICIGDSYHFKNNKNSAVDWTVTDNEGTTQTFTNLPFIDVLFTKSGIYTITLETINNQFCNDQHEIKVEIFDIPSSPLAIITSDPICIYELSTYTIPDLTSDQIVEWEIFDGSLSPTLQISDKLTYSWTTSGPYSISAKIINLITVCKSEAKLEVFNTEHEILGTDQLCVTDEADYVYTNYRPKSNIQWQISPPNAGTIVFSDQDYCTVIWNIPGLNQIKAVQCGTFETIDVGVLAPTDFSLDFDAKICIGEQSTLIIPTTSAESFEVTNEFNNVIGTTSPLSLNEGIYDIIFTNQFGCRKLKNIEVKLLDPVFVEIKVTGSTLQCPPFENTSLYVDNPNIDYSYEWFEGSTLIGTGITIPIINPGIYYCIATDSNGCKKVSGAVSFIACCNSDAIPDVPLIGNQDSIDCFSRSFEVFQPHLSTKFSWSFGDGTFVGDTSAFITHTYTNAGYYLVKTFGNAPCDSTYIFICDKFVKVYVCEGASFLVSIPLSAKFTTATSCPGDTVWFDNRTELIDDITPTYTWDFNDPFDTGSGSPINTENPYHIYEEAGTYSVTLTASEPGGCISTKTIEITIDGGPDISIIANDIFCLGTDVPFDAVSSETNLTYRWDFGDPLSDVKNFSKEQSPNHKYSDTGIYTVTLEVKYQGGCISTVTKDITIQKTTITGNITTPDVIPKCPGSSVVLNGPTLGGPYTYLWSTGETTPSINVVDPIEYSVTVYDLIGCSFATPYFDVIDSDFLKSVIKAQKSITDDGFFKTYLDSISICRGEEFRLVSSQYSFINAIWSNGNTGQYIPYSFLETLPSGRHEFFVTLKVNNCENTIGPFIVNIIDIPDVPIIEADNAQLCENTPIEVSITNYNTAYNYEWSTGQAGASITVFSSGDYSVKVSNYLGCTIFSDTITLHPSPSINVWMDGCIDICFPKELCLNLPIDNNYELILDGVSLGIVTTPDGILDVLEPGDYQLLATNQFGCQKMSDILTLTAIPQDQTLEGIVYLDNNENDVYNLGDSLLQDVPVFLMNGNTIVDQTITDINGHYIFDSILYNNLEVVIDPIITGLTYTGKTDSLIIYQKCVEDKIVNFPLIPGCLSVKQDSIFNICIGTTIMIDGNMYSASDKDTLAYQTIMGCDSIVMIEVLPILPPIVIPETFAACKDLLNGSLIIHGLGDGYSFNFTNGGIQITDTIINNMGGGDYTLYVTNEYGCISLHDFTIPEVPTPLLDIISTSTCSGVNDGVIDIISNNTSLIYSLSIDDVMTPNTLYEGLEAGDYTIYYQDSIGCIFEDYITIGQYISPILSINTSLPCENQSNGILNINVTSGEPIFALDSNDVFTDNLFYENLNPGDYTLYIQSEDGCPSSMDFSLEEQTEPQIDITTTFICDGQQNGVVNISSDIDDLTYSLDGINFNDNNTISDLDSGSYILYLSTASGCVFEDNFDIDTIVTPQVTITTDNTCNDQNNGMLSIEILSGTDLLFTIEGDVIQSDLIFDNLTVGDGELGIIYGNGCYKAIPYEILEHPIPEIDISTNNTCKNETNGSIDIIETLGNNLSYSLDGINFLDQHNFNDLSAGESILYVQTSEGCAYNFPFQIDEDAQPIVSVDTEPSCDDNASGSINITSMSNNTLVSINQSEFTDKINYENLASGIYMITIMNENQCMDSIQVEIPILPKLEVEIPLLELDCYDKVQTITPTIISSHGTPTYLWNDGSTTIELVVKNSGIYNLTIMDECSNQQFEWDINLSIVNDDSKLHIPNIFSPNDDGANDCFVITPNPAYDIISFRVDIFDRWGNRMYQYTDLSDCWNGKFNDTPVRPGVFVYLINMSVMHCNRIENLLEYGDVTVVR
ncbi:MAG: PKD domain-containing protein [Saprospiraceae bacterium]